MKNHFVAEPVPVVHKSTPGQLFKRRDKETPPIDVVVLVFDICSNTDLMFTNSKPISYSGRICVLFKFPFKIRRDFHSIRIDGRHITMIYILAELLPEVVLIAQIEFDALSRKFHLVSADYF